MNTSTLAIDCNKQTVQDIRGANCDLVQFTNFNPNIEAHRELYTAALHAVQKKSGTVITYSNKKND